MRSKQFWTVSELIGLEENSGIIELDTSIVYPNDLTKWTQTIIQCYKNQLKMNEIVVKNICHLGRREEALFHISLWVCQPCLHIECDLATVAVEQTLKSCTWLIICNICKCHLILKLLLSVCVSINKCPQFLLEIRYYSIPLQLIKRVTDQKWNCTLNCINLCLFSLLAFIFNVIIDLFFLQNHNLASFPTYVII